MHHYVDLSDVERCTQKEEAFVKVTKEWSALRLILQLSKYSNFSAVNTVCNKHNFRDQF